MNKTVKLILEIIVGSRDRFYLRNIGLVPVSHVFLSSRDVCIPRISNKRALGYGRLFLVHLPMRLLSPLMPSGL